MKVCVPYQEIIKDCSKPNLNLASRIALFSQTVSGARGTQFVRTPSVPQQLLHESFEGLRGS